MLKCRKGKKKKKKKIVCVSIKGVCDVIRSTKRLHFFFFAFLLLFFSLDYKTMVLTRFQQANLDRNNDRHEAVLVKDPPLLTISRSCDSFEDDLSETTVKVDSLLEQLDE